ncbi:MAG: post-PEP-CTERM-1 domain-containing protein [Candidatus Rokuibacteriota bacterium]
MVVGIDPETGRLGMPTPEQMEELSGLATPEIDHSSEGLVEVHHPDGSVSVDLQGRFQEFATVRIGQDGKLVFQCVDGRDNAERLLRDSGDVPAAGARAKPAAEER